MYIDRRLIFLIIALMLFSSLMTLLSRENGLLIIFLDYQSMIQIYGEKLEVVYNSLYMIQ